MIGWGLVKYIKLAEDNIDRIAEKIEIFEKEKQAEIGEKTHQ